MKPKIDICKPGLITRTGAKLIITIVLAALVCSSLFSGCGKFSLIPVTLKEFKDLVVGKQQSFSHPLNLVLSATVASLKEADFKIRKIELFNDIGSVEAHWEETIVVIDLKSITPKMTKATSKISRETVMREYSSEETIFRNVARKLEKSETRQLSDLAQGMTPVYQMADGGSPVIAYFSSGSQVKVIDEVDGWARIALSDGVSGFMDLSRVKNLK